MIDMARTSARFFSRGMMENVILSLVTWALFVSSWISPAWGARKDLAPHPFTGRELVPDGVDREHPIHETSRDGPNVLEEGRLEPAAVQTTAPVAWPPAQMSDLPADYLDRLRSALQRLADGIERLKAADNPVLWVRSGIAGFTLGQHVDELNEYFERESFEYSPHKKFGFSLFSSSFVRAYGLLNDRTGVIKGRLSPAAQENFEKTLWRCAKGNSQLGEAQRGVWEMEGSENHHMASKVSDFLVAQFLKDIPAYADLRYDDGSTLRQQYEARLAYWSRWIDEHAGRGLFIEDGSSYQNYTVEALFNLRDFAEDAVLRRKVDMFLDLVFANFAEETLGTQRGGPKSRTKEEGFRSRNYDLLFDSPGETFALSSYMLPTSNYYPPPAIVSLARDITTRGPYSYMKRCPGAVAWGSTHTGSLWRTIDRENTMVRHGFATSHYHMGSHGLNTTAKVDTQHRYQRWQGIVFANDPMARIGLDGKSGGKGYITNPFKTIQDRNVMVTVKWGPLTDKDVDPHLWIYFSAVLDAVEEEDGWIFVKSGGAFAAVRVVEGGYRWERAWVHRDTFHPREKSFISLTSDSPVITVANDAADYNDDFASFKAALKAQPITYADGVLKFATITHEGPFAPGKVHGETVELRPSRVNDSPFIRSEWDSGVIYVRKGDETLKLDFRDPRDPVKTVGSPVTSAFPAGVGNAKPIVFR